MAVKHWESLGDSCLPVIAQPSAMFGTWMPMRDSKKDLCDSLVCNHQVLKMHNVALIGREMLLAKQNENCHIALALWKHALGQDKSMKYASKSPFAVLFLFYASCHSFHIRRISYTFVEHAAFDIVKQSIAKISGCRPSSSFCFTSWWHRYLKQVP